MNELLENLQLHIAALPANTAVTLLHKALPKERDFIQANAKLLYVTREYYEGLLSKGDYEVALARLKRSLDFFMSVLTREKLELLGSSLGVEGGAPARARNILFVESLPLQEQRLQLDLEFRKISSVIDRENKHRFTLQLPLMAATFNGLVECLNRYQPSIVHFSGHGLTTGIVLSTEDNQTELVPTAALCRIFSLFRDTTACILLNACYTAPMAAALSREIKNVIGMQYPVSDMAAIHFAETFYTALCHAPETDYRKAYSQGIAGLMVKSEEQAATPQLWHNGELYADNLTSSSIPRV